MTAALCISNVIENHFMKCKLNILYACYFSLLWSEKE